MLPIIGATASNTPTWTPKKETNTNTVPLVKKPDASLWETFSRPTTTPNRNTTHNIVAWYGPVKPNPRSTAKTTPTRNAQLPTRCALLRRGAAALRLFAI